MTNLNYMIRVLVLLFILIAAQTTRNGFLIGVYLLFASIHVYRFRAGLYWIQDEWLRCGGVVIVAAAIAAPVAVFRDPMNFVHFGVLLLTFLLGVVFVARVRAVESSLQILLVLAQTLLVAYIWVEGVGGYPLDFIHPASSSNIITAMLLLIQISHSVTRFVVRGQVAWVTGIITLLICLIGYGRGSIVVAAGVLVVSVVALLLDGGGRGAARRSVLFILVVAIAVSGLMYHDALEMYVVENTKIGRGFVSEQRDSIWSEYLAGLGLFDVIFGADLGYYIEQEFNGNPHSSFLRAHHMFGLMYVMSILLLPMLLIGKVMTRRVVKAYFFAMVALMLVRASSEGMLFPSLLDIFYFLPCLVLIRASGGFHGAAWRPMRTELESA